MRPRVWSLQLNMLSHAMVADSHFCRVNFMHCHSIKYFAPNGITTIFQTVASWKTYNTSSKWQTLSRGWHRVRDHGLCFLFLRVYGQMGKWVPSQHLARNIGPLLYCEITIMVTTKFKITIAITNLVEKTRCCVSREWLGECYDSCGFVDREKAKISHKAISGDLVLDRTLYTYLFINQLFIKFLIFFFKFYMKH